MIFVVIFGRFSCCLFGRPFGMFLGVIEILGTYPNHLLKSNFKALGSNPQNSTNLSIFSVFFRIRWADFRTCLYEVLVTCLGFASNTFATSTPVLSISRKPRKPWFESMFFELLSKLWSFGVKFYGHLQNILEKANVEVMHWLLSADWTKEEKVKTWSNKVQLSSNFIFLGFWGVSLICSLLLLDRLSFLSLFQVL